MSPNSYQFWNFFRPKIPTFPGSRMDKQNISLNSILHCPRRSKGVGVRGWQSSKSDQSEAACDQSDFLLEQSWNTLLLLAMWPAC